jgi:hypothetical protein
MASAYAPEKQISRAALKANHVIFIAIYQNDCPILTAPSQKQVGLIRIDVQFGLSIGIDEVDFTLYWICHSFPLELNIRPL